MRQQGVGQREHEDDCAVESDLWQYEYSKSHRDIQRNFVRRWLHYDLMLAEPLPELSTVRAFFGGITSGPLFEGGEVFNGLSLVLSSPVFATAVTITVMAPDPVTPAAFAADLQTELQNGADSRFTTQVIEDRGKLAATGSIVAVAPGGYTDGQTFTLSDGVNSETFEFDTVPDGVTAGNIPVDISAAATDADVATAIDAAITTATALNITPSLSVATVSLTNDFAGELGNQAITTAGSPPGTYTGMANGLGGDLVRVDAPFPFTVAVGTTLATFSVGDDSRAPSGTGGAGVGQRTYKVPISLEGLDIQEDDFLVLDGFAHRISAVLDDALDQFPFQRIVVKQALPTAPVGSWELSGWVQSELLDFYNGLVAQGDPVDFEIAESSSANAPTLARKEIVTTTILGVNDELPSRAAFDSFSIGDELVDDTLRVLLARVVRRTYVPRDEFVCDVPTLRRLIVIEDDEETLRRNVDFFLEEVRGGFGIRFVSGQSGDPGDVWEGGRPPNRLWAEYTYLDNRPLIEANFGLAVELTVDQLEELPENIDYLSAVRGLWYAFFNGPTIRNLRIGTQILLGLPFAETRGTIQEIRTDFSPSEGRMLIQDVDNEEIVRSYNFPRELPIEVNPATGVQYVVGDTVEEFAPLVEGAEVIDYITDPRWFEGILNQGIFFEIEKFHKFVVRIDSAAFNLSSLLFVRNFILKIKPTYTFPLFLVLLEIGDTEVSTVDQIDYTGTLKLFDLPCEGSLGIATMYDQGRPGGGGWRNQYDGDSEIDAHLQLLLVFDSSLGTFTNETAAAQDTITSFEILPPDPVEVGDITYFGFDDLPDEVAFNIVGGAGVWAVVWEFFDGTSWTALAGVVDGTAAFTAAGTNSLTFTVPTTAERTTVNGSALLFFIRSRVTTGDAAPVTIPRVLNVAVAGTNAPATFPTPATPIAWAWDKMYNCPLDEVVGQCCVTLPDVLVDITNVDPTTADFVLSAGQPYAVWADLVVAVSPAVAPFADTFTVTSGSNNGDTYTITAINSPTSIRATTGGGPPVTENGQTIDLDIPIMLDSCFKLGTPVSEKIEDEAINGFIIAIPPAGYQFGGGAGTPANLTGTITQFRFYIGGDPGTDPTDYDFVIQIDTGGGFSNAHVESFTAGVNTEILVTGLSIAVTAADDIRPIIRPSSGGARSAHNYTRFRSQITISEASPWNLGDRVDSGTYCSESLL